MAAFEGVPQGGDTVGEGAFAALVKAYNSLLAKLDADVGVTDTDYVATHDLGYKGGAPTPS